MKEYISDLFGKIPTIDDYNNSIVPDPDKSSLKEYEDFKKLIDGWNGDLFTEEPYRLYGSFELELKRHSDSSTKYRLGGDQMITGWLQNLDGRSLRLSPRVKQLVKSTDPSLVNKFINARYAPGNFIFWPRHYASINTARAGIRGGGVEDRIDLTLECLRLWYEGKTPPCIGKAIERDSAYFKLFESFEFFVSFFALEPFVIDGIPVDLLRSNLDKESSESKFVAVTDASFKELLPSEVFFEHYLKNTCSIISRRTEALGF